MKFECNSSTPNVCDFYLVVYRDKVHNEIARVEAYDYDEWGGTSYSSSDIDSYKYGYNAEIIDVVDFVSTKEKEVK